LSDAVRNPSFYRGIVVVACLQATGRSVLAEMKMRITIGIALGIACIMAGCAGCAMLEARQIRAERDRVHGLVAVGHSFFDAQRVLKEKGYALLYKEPIHPTQAKDYVQQLVIIGETQPTASDTFFYVTTGGANPLWKESPYVILEAGNDGIITRVE
jgi:hypothetical protein